ncbi:MAG: helicase C-terminal domain-containing protein [Planctomycetota bacterium]
MRTETKGTGVGPDERRPPWDRPGLATRLAFVDLVTLGPDPAEDGLVHVAALVPRRKIDSRLAETVRSSDPVVVQLCDELGLLAGAKARSAREVFATLVEKLEGCLVLTRDAPLFERYHVALVGAPFEGIVLDLDAVALMLGPTRSRRAVEAAPGDDRAGWVQERLLDLLEPLGRLDPAAMAVIAHLADERIGVLEATDPVAAEGAAAILAAVEHPHLWALRPGEDFAPRTPGAGLLSDAIRAYGDLDSALEAALPAAVRPADDTPDAGPMPVTTKDPAPTLTPEDAARVDAIFHQHLPAHFARGGEPRFRSGQHQVATGVAKAWGERSLHLIHAPTGTGKTLAYLVPTMLWALRFHVRIAVATYTRALQEQAVERDVPLARMLLERAGVTEPILVAALKGRGNYVCWRALRAALPEPEETAAQIAAWMHLAMFTFLDPEGDLDRLRSTGAEREGDAFVRALRTLTTAVRSQTGCCTHMADRNTCCAELARRRAERSHVVITNHALALARRDLFRRFVFDECEHLHDVAHNAFSHVLPLPQLKGLLERTGGGSRSVLARLSRRASAGGPAGGALVFAQRATAASEIAFANFEDEAVRFADWRERTARERGDETAHSLFREYFDVKPRAAADLARTHGDLERAVDALVGGLARLAEHLDAFAMRGTRRARRRLDLVRAELGDAAEALFAWIPRDGEGAPFFRSETFYDLERNAKDEDVLAARVLLPHEYLGRRFWPDLDAAALLSATTWLKGGFDAASNYLGLTRAANPADDEDREACRVETLRTPEAFDYSRVLIGVPRDAPSVRDKRRWLEYCARSIAFVAERARGRTLALFTNADDVRDVARRLEPFFQRRHLPLLWQNMPGSRKEELSDRFRARVDSTLLGVDTFWYGADFPGETLEYLFLARLPYGVPDRYHQAQCAVLGPREQRRQIYMPRALAKFRQGFGRLLRNESDRGACFILDQRILEPRHRSFLRELPLDETGDGDGATFLRAESERVYAAAFEHMDLPHDGANVSFDAFELHGIERPSFGHEYDDLAR